MPSYYNQNYTKDEIEKILFKIKDCVRKNRFTISLNDHRQDNIDFIQEYNLNSGKQKSILLAITANDFCHSLKNTKPGYEHEVLFVFIPQVKLVSLEGIEEPVDIYIKFNLIELPSGSRTVVISFHKRKKDVQYLFR